MIDDQGRVVGSYDKIHLVPFGEYLPFQDFLESFGVMQMTGVRGGFSVGAGPRRLAVPGAPAASPLICYEIIFPDEVDRGGRAAGMAAQRRRTTRGSDRARGPISISIKRACAPSSRACRSPARANTGISAVIDPYGRILAEIGLGEKGAIDADLPKVGPTTPYVQFGIVLEISMLALCFAGWLACRVQPIRPHH